MERNEVKQFLKLQSALILLLLTVIPEISFKKALGGAFSQMSGMGINLFDINIAATICKLVGIAGAGYLLYQYYDSYQQEKRELPVPFFAASGAGLLLALLTFFFDPIWFEAVTAIILFYACFTAKKSLGVEWSTPAVQGAYIILIAMILHAYLRIDDHMLLGILTLVGLILYLKGLTIIKDSLDVEGSKGAAKLRIAVILGIIGVFIGWIPIVGSVVGGILALVAFFMELVGYGILRNSNAIGEEGKVGAGKLRLSMILLLVAIVLGWIPVIKGFSGLLVIYVMWLVFEGWSMIALGISSTKKLPEDIVTE